MKRLSMRRLKWVTALTAIALLTLGPVFSQTQTAMNRKAAKAAQASDERMHTRYFELLNLLPDELARHKLRSSQRVWELMREKAARFAADKYRGGSLSPMEYAGVFATCTRARIQFLETEIDAYRAR